ncbi:hypothetical protein T01_3824 [Trichinella spiralis]|uniref:Uncharacterized protein n=1 Tax=Trichinella spiralis TaxID=6334 RepID=A0A0V1BYN9_TRISP|nr:hypothetical protein T01_3824 [Trichinella spiralis]
MNSKRATVNEWLVCGMTGNCPTDQLTFGSSSVLRIYCTAAAEPKTQNFTSFLKKLMFEELVKILHALKQVASEVL